MKGRREKDTVFREETKCFKVKKCFKVRMRKEIG